MKQMNEDLLAIDHFFNLQSQDFSLIFDSAQQEKDLYEKISNIETSPKYPSDEYFAKDQSKKTTKKPYTRKKDHNRMKKIHSLIFKSLKKTIGLKKMNELGSFRHRHDYLMIGLIIASHFDVSQMFCRDFTEKLLLCFQANLRSESKLENPDYSLLNQSEALDKKDRIFLNESIRNVLEAIRYYQEGNFNQCVETLYDKDKIKNKQYFQQAKIDAQHLMKLSSTLKCEQPTIPRTNKEKFTILMAKYKPVKRCSKKKKQ